MVPLCCMHNRPHGLLVGTTIPLWRWWAQMTVLLTVRELMLESTMTRLVIMLASLATAVWFRWPEFVKARWSNTTLQPGECLFIPKHHALHYVGAVCPVVCIVPLKVRGFGEENIAYSLLFDTHGAEASSLSMEAEPAIVALFTFGVYPRRGLSLSSNSMCFGPSLATLSRTATVRLLWACQTGRLP